MLFNYLHCVKYVCNFYWLSEIFTKKPVQIQNVLSLRVASFLPFEKLSNFYVFRNQRQVTIRNFRQLSFGLESYFFRQSTKEMYIQFKNCLLITYICKISSPFLQFLLITNDFRLTKKLVECELYPRIGCSKSIFGSKCSR